MSIKELVKEIHENAVAHGWWEKDVSFGEIIALCHSELSEALEEYRNERPNVYEHCIYCDLDTGNGFSKDCKIQKKPEGVAVELADCVIRIFDYCGKKNINIEEIIKLKHEYNKTRPYKHGGKKI